MMKIAVLVSGGGTNLQAIIDAIDAGKITDARICLVLSNNKNAYALERAKAAGIPALAISPKDYESRDLFNEAMLEAVLGSGAELVVLAGFLCVIPPRMVEAYPNRIINIHPSLIPSFCGTRSMKRRWSAESGCPARRFILWTRERTQGRSSCRRRWRF